LTNEAVSQDLMQIVFMTGCKPYFKTWCKP